MGFNFRKRIKVGPGSINLSKSGVGISIGGTSVRWTGKKRKKTKKTDSPGCLASVLYLSIGGAALSFIIGYAEQILLVLLIAAAALLAFIFVRFLLHRKAAGKFPFKTLPAKSVDAETVAE